MTDQKGESGKATTESEVMIHYPDVHQSIQQHPSDEGDAAAIVLAAVAQVAVNQMLVPVSSSSSSSSLGGAVTSSSSNDMAVATAAAAAAIALSSVQATSVNHNPPIQLTDVKQAENIEKVTSGDVTSKLTNGTIKAPENGDKQVNGLTSSTSVLLPTSKSDATIDNVNSPIPQSMGKASASNSKMSSSLRRGKWTLEEEAYVARVIRDFNSGHLAAPAGTTLRTYLSEKLHCDPMRITKKFTGDACIGKRVFHPAVRTAVNASVIDKAQSELKVLEAKWRERLEAQQREASKKAGRHSLHHISSPALSCASNDVTRTAAWLDQADMILHNAESDKIKNSEVDENIPYFTLEEQMENVKRLIHEGPLIQQKSNKLITQNQPEERHVELSKRKVSDCAVDANSKDENSQESDSAFSTDDKKVRKSTSGFNLSSYSNASDADAEALVGFLNAVRRERAYSQG